MYPYLGFQWLRCSEKSRGNNVTLEVKDQARKAKPVTAKKLTTPYPHKYKTVLCKFWVKGQKCPFGNECNYAHGHQQLADKNCEDVAGKHDIIVDNIKKPMSELPHPVEERKSEESKGSPETEEEK